MTMLASESRRYEFTNLHSTNFNKNYIKMLISKAKKNTQNNFFNK